MTCESKGKRRKEKKGGDADVGCLVQKVDRWMDGVECGSFVLFCCREGCERGRVSGGGRVFP